MGSPPAQASGFSGCQGRAHIFPAEIKAPLKATRIYLTAFAKAPAHSAADSRQSLDEIFPQADTIH